MPRYEYKVVPAPAKGLKGKGVRGAEARFSYALQELMNGLAGDGWEYQRAETLPSLERAGLTGTTTEWRNLLVFRRPRDDDAEAFTPELLPAPAPPAQAPAKPLSEPAQPPETVAKISNSPLPDNGVEDTRPQARIGASLSILARARSTRPDPDPDPENPPNP